MRTPRKLMIAAVAALALVAVAVASADTLTGTAGAGGGGTKAKPVPNAPYFSVTESGTQTSSGGEETGNYLTGTYTLSQAASGSYSMTETGTDGAGDTFTLTEHGSTSSTTTTRGNTVAISGHGKLCAQGPTFALNVSAAPARLPCHASRSTKSSVAV